MPHVTVELVGKAYNALASGNRQEIEKYWSADMKWLVPGHNPLSGWWYGLDGFLEFMGLVGQWSNGSFKMTPITVMVNDEYSTDVTHNLGYRAGFENVGEVPYTKLDIDVAHLLRWHEGKVIEGRGGIFGDGTNEYDLFWSPVANHAGQRINVGGGTASSNKALVRKIVAEVWNTGDKKLAHQFYAPNYVFFQEGGGVQMGVSSIEEWLETTHTAFPDITYTVDAVYTDGNKAAMRYHVTGTHTGDFRGMPPTGKPINLTGHTMFRLSDEGKVLEAWGYWDMLGLLQQIGILPPFGPPRR